MSSDQNLDCNELIAQGYQLRSSKWNDFITSKMDPIYWRHDCQGLASFAWQVTGEYLNAAKLLHGGAMCTLLDHSMGALAYLDSSGSFAHTIQMSVQFIQPVRKNRWIMVKAKHLAGNGHNILLSAEAIVNDKVVASAQGTFHSASNVRR